MRRDHHRLRLAATCALLLCLLAASSDSISAQMPQPRGDPLAILKRALSEAGAPPLTSQQEEQLRSLISAFRSARQAQAQNAALEAARRAYENAILNGDSAGAQAQASAIANEIANIARTNLQAEANFKIQVLNVLKTNSDQVNLLLKQIGASGLSRLLSSLSGGRFRALGWFGPFPFGPSSEFKGR